MSFFSITAPPSKSLSHRALIAAALAEGRSCLRHVLESDDTDRTRELFALLGASFTRTGPGAFTVDGLGGRIRQPGSENAGKTDRVPTPVFVGESGTTCRLAAAVLAAGKGSFYLHGSGRMHKRPMGELCEALASLGAGIGYEETPGCLPLCLTARGLCANKLPGGMVRVGCGESSQYLSGLLLAAPLAEGGLSIGLAGGRAVSWPYVGLTLDVMRRFGILCKVERREGPGEAWRGADPCAISEGDPGGVRFTVPAGTYRPASYAVEGDWSGASYFLAAGAIGPLPVRVRGLDPASLQGDAALLGLLAAMGAKVERHEDGVSVSPAPLRGVEADLRACPDLAPTVAALAAHARGATRIRNAEHLRAKESDRLAAPAAELRKAGCRVEESADGLLIQAPEKGLLPLPAGRTFSAHGDHRIAMGLCLLGLPGLAGRGFAVPLDDPSCVSKSFPGFWPLWEGLLAAVSSA